MSVNYLYDHDSADIVVEGRRDTELVRAGLGSFQNTSVFADEIARIERRSSRAEDGESYQRIVFDNADERALVVAGLRTVVSRYEQTPGWRNRWAGRYGRQLLCAIVAAEDLPRR